MERDRIRTLVTEQFYRSLDESGVKLEALPPAQLQAIVKGVADSIFAALAALEEESPTRSRAAEELLWQGKPYLSLGTHYELTSQRLRVISGLFSRSVEEIELVRVRDTRVTQSMTERAFAVGDVTVVSTDNTLPEIVLNNIREPMEVRELIRRAVIQEQERRGVRFREDV